MIETGGAVLPEHYDAVNASKVVPCEHALAAVRDCLTRTLARGTAAHWPDFAGAPVEIRAYASDLHALGVIATMPVGALAMNTMILGWHQDRMAPPGTRNHTTVLRERCTGGMLVLAKQRQAWRMLDSEYLIFDNQEWHGLTEVCCEPDGYRISLVMYLPKAAS